MSMGHPRQGLGGGGSNTAAGSRLGFARAATTTPGAMPVGALGGGSTATPAYARPGSRSASGGVGATDAGAGGARSSSAAALVARGGSEVYGRTKSVSGIISRVLEDSDDFGSEPEEEPELAGKPHAALDDGGDFEDSF
eukprot:331086-Chlamydomonas_euryale.AAC.2